MYTYVSRCKNNKKKEKESRGRNDKKMPFGLMQG
jgi:hypothetical protein